MKLIKHKSLSLSPSDSFVQVAARDPATVRVLPSRDLEALLDRLVAGASNQDEAEAMLREIGLGFGVGDGVGIEELIGRVGSVCGGSDELGTAYAMGECKEELMREFEFFDEDVDGRRITAKELLGVFGGVMGDERCTLEDYRRMIAGGRPEHGRVRLLRGHHPHDEASVHARSFSTCDGLC